MEKVTTSDRLKQIISERGLKQVDILEACQPYCKKYNVQLRKNDLSQYISGKVAPKQDKLTILGLALNVNEVWLMGYDVPSGRKELSQLQEKLPQKEIDCDLFKQCYEKEAYTAVKLFLQLDKLDQGRIIGSMETMLNSEKYSDQKELLDGKAM